MAEPMSPVFAGLTDRDRHVILSAATPRALAAKEVLAREGDAATAFYVVQLGHLKLTKVSSDGNEIVVRFVGPGEPFAGVVAVGQPTYPVSATAVEPTRALGWTREVLIALIADFPQLRTNVVEQITRHMTEALTRVQELTSERVPLRLARALMRLAEHGGVKTAQGLEIAHPVTRQELADLMGATLFTVSRLLADWQHRGIIASKNRRIIITKPAALAAISASSERE